MTACGMAILNAGQITEKTAALPGWAVRASSLHRIFQFADFPAAMAFVNQVARVAEAASHHPDIDIRWNKVTLVLSTHSEGGLTEKDFALAQQINVLFQA